MKVFLLYSAICLSCIFHVFSLPVKNKFLLNGLIIGKPKGFVYLFYQVSDKQVVDSCSLKDGHFQFVGNISEPVLAHFSVYPLGIDYEGVNEADFYIEPSKMKLIGTINHLDKMQFYGSFTDGDRLKLERLRRPIDSIIRLINNTYSNYKSQLKNLLDLTEKDLLQRKADSLNKEINLLYSKRNTIDSIFIVHNSTSFVAIHMLSSASYDRFAFTISDLESIYQRLPPKIKNTAPGKKLKSEIDLESKVKIGSVAKGFTAVSEGGDTVNLQDYKGKKYILLDFWASWCGPCRRMAPIINDIFKKYNPELEIISIAHQDNQDEWRNAIKEDKSNWIQIIENRNNLPLKAEKIFISQTYYINTIPSFIMIDKDFQVIAKFGNGYYSKPVYQLPDYLKEIFLY